MLWFRRIGGQRRNKLRNSPTFESLPPHSSRDAWSQNTSLLAGEAWKALHWLMISATNVLWGNLKCWRRLSIKSFANGITLLLPSKQLNGKELSFNNIRTLMRLSDHPWFQRPSKSSCGLLNTWTHVALVADDIETAWDYAYESDPVSIFVELQVLNPWDAAKLKMHGVFPWNHCCAKLYRRSAWNLGLPRGKLAWFLSYHLTPKMLVKGSRIHRCCWWSPSFKTKTWWKESPVDWQWLPNANQLRQVLSFAWKLSSM